MELEKFGSEVAVVNNTANGTGWNPLHIKVCTPSALTYSGAKDTWQILQEQLKILQKRVAQHVAEQMGIWVGERAEKQLISSKRRHDGQVPIGIFGEETAIKASCYAGGAMALMIWFPSGVIVEPSKQVQLLQEEITKLRQRLVTEFRFATDEYSNSVNITPTEIGLSELGLDAEISLD